MRFYQRIWLLLAPGRYMRSIQPQQFALLHLQNPNILNNYDLLEAYFKPQDKQWREFSIVEDAKQKLREEIKQNERWALRQLHTYPLDKVKRKEVVDRLAAPQGQLNRLQYITSDVQSARQHLYRAIAEREEYLQKSIRVNPTDKSIGQSFTQLEKLRIDFKELQNIICRRDNLQRIFFAEQARMLYRPLNMLDRLSIFFGFYTKKAREFVNEITFIQKSRNVFDVPKMIRDYTRSYPELFAICETYAERPQQVAKTKPLPTQRHNKSVMSQHSRKNSSAGRKHANANGKQHRHHSSSRSASSGSVRKKIATAKSKKHHSSKVDGRRRKDTAGKSIHAKSRMTVNKSQEKVVLTDNFRLSIVAEARRMNKQRNGNTQASATTQSITLHY